MTTAHKSEREWQEQLGQSGEGACLMGQVSVWVSSEHDGGVVRGDNQHLCNTMSSEPALRLWGGWRSNVSLEMKVL